jgi:hypothetical protein
MTVKAYITRDPSGNPWPPVHEHEATAAIGLIQRLHEALDHERAFYGVFANLHVPSADLVVLTELGMGVVELKHYAGQLSVSVGDWYAGNQIIKAGSGYSTPREQVQSYANRIRRELIPYIAEWWSISEDDAGTKLKVQTAVCFTNPDLAIPPQVKDDIEHEARTTGRRWSTFQVLTPASFAAWVSALRFGMEKDRSADFAPQRLTAKQIAALAQAYFKCTEWTEIRNLMPSSTPYAYLTLQQPRQEPILFPLRTTATTIGRDGAKCPILLPEGFKRASREHARLTRVASSVYITDLGSSHGTYVDGEPITATTRLKPGQHITLGGSAANDKVCDLRFTRQLPPEFQAGATAADSTSNPPAGSDESAP